MLPSRLDDLPLELRQEVLRACDVRAAFSMERVSRTWRKLSVDTEEAWKAIFAREYPRDAPLLLPRLGRSRALCRAFGTKVTFTSDIFVNHVPDPDEYDEPVVMLTVGSHSQRERYIMEWNQMISSLSTFPTMTASTIGDDTIFENMFDMEDEDHDYAFNRDDLDFHLTTACYVFVPVSCDDIRLFVLWQEQYPGDVECIDSHMQLSTMLQHAPGDVTTYDHGGRVFRTPCTVPASVIPTSNFPTAARMYSGSFETTLEFRPADGTLVTTEPYRAEPCRHYLWHAEITFGLGQYSESHPESVLTSKHQAMGLLLGLAHSVPPFTLSEY